MTNEREGSSKSNVHFTILKYTLMNNTRWGTHTHTRDIFNRIKSMVLFIYGWLQDNEIFSTQLKEKKGTNTKKLQK